eukprot:COSAG03_NODE_22808_length_286_cov_1.641711_1_plen_74_part_01
MRGIHLTQGRLEHVKSCRYLNPFSCHVFPVLGVDSDVNVIVVVNDTQKPSGTLWERVHLQQLPQLPARTVEAHP